MAAGDGAPRHLAAGHPAGAARIARVLRSLDGDGWSTLSQVHRPGGEGPPLDHVVIGPGGVVVIDSRAWVGRIEVSRGIVQQNGFWREREAAAVAHAAGCIAALLAPQHRTAVHAFICIAQHDLAEHVVSPGVHVVGVTGLGRALRDLPHRLHPAEVLHLNTALGLALTGTVAPEQLTTAELDASPVQVAGAHRDPAAALPPPTGGLAVPVGSRALRSASRSGVAHASARRRPAPVRWNSPRVLVPRVLLAVLLIAVGVAIGPSIARVCSGSLLGTPAVTVLPVSEDGTPTPSPGDAASTSPARGGTGPIWSGGSSPVEPLATGTSSAVAAPTASDQPLSPLAEVTPPGYRTARGGSSPSP